MSLRDPAERSATGARLQAELLAEPAPAPRTLLQASWRDFVFAEVWTRPGLDRRSRFWISLTSAALSAGSVAPLEGYIKGALTLGDVTLPELREAALHIAVYGGWSRGMIFDDAVSCVADSLGLADAPFASIRGEPWEPEARHAEGRANFETITVAPSPPPETAYFEAGIINFVFGEMWMRPGLDQRARRWITLVGVANSAARTPIRSHVYAAMAAGDATREEMLEFVLQYAIHGGWPMASVVQGAVFEQAARVAQGLPFEP